MIEIVTSAIVGGLISFLVTRYYYKCSMEDIYDYQRTLVERNLKFRRGLGETLKYGEFMITLEEIAEKKKKKYFELEEIILVYQNIFFSEFEKNLAPLVYEWSVLKKCPECGFEIMQYKRAFEQAMNRDEMANYYYTTCKICEWSQFRGILSDRDPFSGLKECPKCRNEILEFTVEGGSCFVKCLKCGWEDF